MDLKKIFVFVVCFLFLISFLNFVSAGIWTDFKENKYVKSTVDKSQKILGFKSIEENDSVFGIKIWGFNNWFRYFGMGIFAGFYLWLIYGVFHFFENLHSLLTSNKLGQNPFDGGKTMWFGLVAGRLHRVLLIGLVYAFLMQIPIINRVIQIITLEFWIPDSFWLLPLIISFELGLGPFIYSRYMRERMRINYEKAIIKSTSGGN